MASSTEVTNLRKAGRLAEARAMARELLGAHPEDVWNRRAFAWVLYAQIKQALEKGAPKEAAAFLQEFDALAMPGDEVLLHQHMAAFRLKLLPNAVKAEARKQAGQYAEALNLLWEVYERDPQWAASPELHQQIAWAIWRFLKNLDPAAKNSFSLVQTWTSRYRMLTGISRPSLIHSVLLNQLLHLPEPLKAGFDFLDWFRFWNIPNDFEEKDWQPFAGPEHTSPPLAERACNAWCRALIRQGRGAPEEEVREAMQRLEAISLAHPEYLWLPYFMAKIRIDVVASDPAAARRDLLPFVRRKRTEFWVWDLLADTFGEKEAAEREACLCMALTCHADPSFLAKVRLRLIRLLLERQAFDRARYELEAVETLKKERKERIPAEVTQGLVLPVVAAAPLPGAESQRAYYRETAALAENIAFENQLVRGVGVVDGIDTHTGTVYFALTREIRGRFPAGKFRKWTFQPGDFLELSLAKREIEGREIWQVHSLVPTKQMPPEDLFRIVTGPVKQPQGQAAGWVADVYIPPRLMDASGLHAGDAAGVAAVWSFDPKKKQFGWKAIQII
jgi:hypothetical protein